MNPLLYIEAQKIRARDWFLAHAEGPHVKGWLAFFSFLESFIFPIPVDPLLIAILMAGATRWVYYALLTTAFSVLGGVAGYLIGAFFFVAIGKPIIAAYHLGDEMARVGELFEEWSFVAMFIAAFSPIPYKVFTIAAGFFHIDLATFFLASVVGRGLRFFAVAYLAKEYGRMLGSFLFRYFNAVTIVIALALIIFFVVVR